MLDKMREGSQGVAAKVILIVIILSFALAGVSGYLGGSGASVAVVVNDQEISQANVEQAYQNERGRLQQQYGEQFDILASSPNFAQQLRAQATQTLISDALIAQAISDMGLRVGDEQVKDAIRNMSEFQIDGKFDNEHYLSVLRRASYTPAQFSENLKRDLVRRQLSQSLLGSEFVLPTEVSIVQALQSQQRVTNVLNISAADFASDLQVNDEEVKAYYDNNTQLFQYPEQISAEYVLLDGTELAAQVSVTDDEIETYYDHHQGEYKRNERRKVAHILIQGDSDEAQQKAAAILAELNNGADFATLAAEKSDDTLSAKNGGDLSWIERGVMEPEFDQAAYVLTVDAPVSEVVKTKFGYHIIKLVDIQESKVKTLDEVKEQIQTTLTQEKANELYFELQQQLSEVAFESPDNLIDSADAINGKVVATDFFSRDKAPDALEDNKVLQTLFDTDFRDEGMNSELIELAENKAVVLRVNDYKPAATQPLTEVRDAIITQLKADASRKEALAFSQSMLDKLNASESITDDLESRKLTFINELTITRFNRDYDYKVVEALFKLAKPANGDVSRDLVVTSSGDYAVIELLSVVEEQTADTPATAQIDSILQRSTSEATYQALVSELMENADIKYAVAN